MATNTPAERLAAADASYCDLVLKAAEARIVRDRLVYEFRASGELSDAEMADVLRGHRSWPQQLADAFPERLRRHLAAIKPPPPTTADHARAVRMTSQ